MKNARRYAIPFIFAGVVACFIGWSAAMFIWRNGRDRISSTQPVPTDPDAGAPVPQEPDVNTTSPTPEDGKALTPPVDLESFRDHRRRTLYGHPAYQEAEDGEARKRGDRSEARVPEALFRREG